MPIDYKKYPPNWKKEIVPRILERANNRCEKCGLENKQTVYAIKLWVRGEGGKYQFKTLWFSSENDAKREDLHGNIKPVKVVLTISHLDHDETNHEVSDDRLEANCQLCHLRYDASEKFRRVNGKKL